jgi:2-C-methyl-D-erythritol 2,4-cyclodiphosphate synthase
MAKHQSGQDSGVSHKLPKGKSDSTVSGGVALRGRDFIADLISPVMVRAMNFVGIGYDVHPLAEGRKLVLGGVEIPHPKGLEGHSDADALMHAVCDAVLGALGERDIGTFFPNTDARWKGAPSATFLREAARQVKLRQGRIVNVDATVIAQEPKIGPHIQLMKERIGAALEIEARRVGVKATTNERLGFVGREEGIAAMAVASVEMPEEKHGQG